MNDVLHVNVTHDCIKNGERCHSTKCPAALAILNIWRRGETRVTVGPDDCHIERFVGRSKKRISATYALPEEAKKWILWFDAHQTMEPIQFMMTKVK